MITDNRKSWKWEQTFLWDRQENEARNCAKWLPRKAPGRLEDPQKMKSRARKLWYRFDHQMRVICYFRIISLHLRARNCSSLWPKGDEKYCPEMYRTLESSPWDSSVVFHVHYFPVIVVVGKPFGLILILRVISEIVCQQVTRTTNSCLEPFGLLTRWMLGHIFLVLRQRRAYIQFWSPFCFRFLFPWKEYVPILEDPLLNLLPNSPLG